ncbi:MAG: hypothetical protein KAX80_05995 [Planctomycetes bacterium]|nr:hypothetical protein [Planctomycetota bacterium]
MSGKTKKDWPRETQPACPGFDRPAVGVGATRAVTATVILMCLLSWLPLRPARAQTYREYSSVTDKASKPAPKKEDQRSPEEVVKEKAEELAGEAERRVQDFALRADMQLASLSSSRVLGWAALVAMVLVGSISLLRGWFLFDAALVPFTSAWGMVTGGVIGFLVMGAIRPAATSGLQFGALAAGAMLGLAVGVFAARRAKPVAAFLVILSPFLLLSILVFPQSAVGGLILFSLGLLGGMLAMVRMGTMTVLATGVFGACTLMAAYGLLGHLLSSQEFLRDSFKWLLGDTVVLLIVLAVVAFMGIHFQRTAVGAEGTN